MNTGNGYHLYEEVTTKVRTIWDNSVKVIHRLDTNDNDIIRSIMMYDEYMTKKFSYENGDTFVDLGTHIGVWSILMASLNPTFKVYSYEPIPENFKLIKKNISINKLNNVHPFNLAVSDGSEGQESIYYTNDDTKYGKIHKFVGSMSGGSGHEIKVEKISLNDVLDKVDRCKVLKCDCEGCEVKGFSTLTKENLLKIDNIIGEFHPRGIDFDTFLSYFKPHFTNNKKVSKYVTPTDLRLFLLTRNKK